MGSWGGGAKHQIVRETCFPNGSFLCQVMSLCSLMGKLRFYFSSQSLEGFCAPPCGEPIDMDKHTHTPLLSGTFRYK